MANVNVPPQTLPRVLLEKYPELVPLFEERDFFNYQMWKRSGGGSDTIEEITSSESYENSFSGGGTQEQIETLEQIEDLIPRVGIRYEPSVKVSDYTAIDLDFIEARGAVNITLDPYADEGADIIVANGDGTVITVTAPIKIRGIQSSVLLRNEGTSLHFKNFGEYWRIK